LVKFLVLKCQPISQQSVKFSVYCSQAVNWNPDKVHWTCATGRSLDENAVISVIGSYQLNFRRFLCSRLKFQPISQQSLTFVGPRPHAGINLKFGRIFSYHLKPIKTRPQAAAMLAFEKSNPTYLEQLQSLNLLTTSLPQDVIVENKRFMSCTICVTVFRYFQKYIYDRFITD